MVKNNYYTYDIKSYNEKKDKWELETHMFNEKKAEIYAKKQSKKENKAYMVQVSGGYIVEKGKVLK